MKKCLNCGKENPDTSKFCGYCGKNLPAQAEGVMPPFPQPPRAEPPPMQQPGYQQPGYQQPGYQQPPNLSYPGREEGYAGGQPPAMQYQSQGRNPQPDAYSYAERPTPPVRAAGRPGGQQMRSQYPPPPMRPPRSAAGGMDKSMQQRLIIIAAVVFVLFGIIICAVVGWTQKDNIAGMIDPAGRETQVKKDIEIGLTLTSSVSVDVPATVQAQIAMTQAAASGGQAPAPAPQPIPAQPEGQSAAPSPAAAGGDGEGYVSTVKQQIPQYAQAMDKINDLFNNPKIDDEQWKSDFSSATGLVTQTSQSIRQLTAPPKYQEAHKDLLNAATKLDTVVGLLTEYLNTKVDATLVQATKERDEGNALLKSYLEKVDQLSAQP